MLDSLFAAGELGPTAAVFVMPGIPEGFAATVPGQMPHPTVNRQRSVEYDSCTPAYGEFYLQTYCPLLRKSLASR